MSASGRPSRPFDCTVPGKLAVRQPLSEYVICIDAASQQQGYLRCKKDCAPINTLGKDMPACNDGSQAWLGMKLR